MSKIAEKALEEYPKETYYDRDVCDYVDVNATRRDGYIKGYDQAMQDFMEKACEWLSKQPMSRPMFWTVEDFKKYMEEEL